MVRIYEFDELNDQKKDAVIQSFGYTKDCGEIIFAIDNTILGSCKDGCIITDNFLITRESFQNPVRHNVCDINHISCEKKLIKINGREVFKFQMPEESDLEDLFNLLNSNLNEDEDEDEDEDEGEEFVEALLFPFNAMLNDLKKSKPTEDVKLQIASMKFFIGIGNLANTFESKFFPLRSDYIKSLSFVFKNQKTKLAMYTYVASYIKFILWSEARFDIEKSERYFQYPFVLINAVIKFTEGPSEKTISSAAKKNSDVSNSSSFKQCCYEFGYFCQYLDAKVSCGERYIHMLQSLILDDIDLVKFQKIQNALRDENLAIHVDNELQKLELNIKKLLINILEEFSANEQFPSLFNNTAKPSHLFTSINKEKLNKRIFLEVN